MKTNLLSCRALLLAGAMSSVCLSPRSASAHESPSSPAHSGSADGSHREMRKEMRREMMEQAESTDREIQKLAERMNSASGEQQLDAMRAVINKLLEQRTAMHQKMMHGKMGGPQKPSSAEKETAPESEPPSETSESRKP